ncbi:DUF1329 domain-containing protein [Azospirillum sp.]|uniref:DUF1329 domain-containing protein n=1 Tax=Azospirillum sp. TaxID=34012 RepID=UPI00261C3453|nr:DUF1329 domain-containing protein [Azospirillum sp.]
MNRNRMTTPSTVSAGRIAMLAAVGAAALLARPVMAETTPQDLARLGKDLTPVGAETAGNKDGSIPAWTGGLTKIPAGFDPAQGYADPFASDAPLYTITAANADQYKDKLAPGQIALLKRYPGYKMKVYPSRRTAALPQAEYDLIRNEAAAAQLAEGGNGVLNITATTVPFPVPKSGVEAIWNHIMHYRGGTYLRYGTEFPVHTNGGFTPLRRTEWYARASSLGNAEPNRLHYYLNLVTAPSSIAGEAILTHEPVDQVKETRLAWTYNPGQRRVLRAPSVSYDSPGTGTDGLRTMDDYDGFNGAPDRYDWKLVGKKEMIIAYNNYKLTDKSLKYSNIIMENTVNQDLVRYEPHRVWVVQATLKPGARHLYGKRDFYIDEDTWAIAHKDQYDGRGELWRVHEFYQMLEYDVMVPFYAGNVLYDLQARRYLVHQLSNEEKPAKYGAKFELSRFAPDSLRRVSN